MAEQTILNQAAIDAARAKEARRIEQLAAAKKEEARLAALVPYATQIQDIGKTLTQTLQARGGESAERGLGTTAASMEKQQKEVLTPYANIGDVIAGLSTPVKIPAAIYGDTGPTLAADIFKKTLALFFGDDEVKNPWVDELYKVVSGYYKQGATIDEALNFSLRDARNNPNLTKFTNRFRAIFALEDKLKAGQAVYVPSISEYVQTEIKVGDIFRAADLGALANQDFIADVLSKNKSVSEITSLVSNVFNLIDTAPELWKKELAAKFPTATRSGLAQAILLGEESAKALEKTAQVTGVQAAAKAQGLAVSAERAQDIFAQGYGFARALPAFGEVAAILPRAQQLAEFSRQAPVTQLDVEQARIEGLASQQRKLIQLAEEERARLSGSSGTTRFSSSQALKGTF